MANTHLPDEMTYEPAARVVAALVHGARQWERRSVIDGDPIALKDTSRDMCLSDALYPATTYHLENARRRFRV